MAFNTFATPVVVTELETAGFDMSFQINQGATIWDELVITVLINKYRWW